VLFLFKMKTPQPRLEEKISILDGLRGFAPLLGLKPRSPKTSIELWR